jgi:hypothetical protein
MKHWYINCFYLRTVNTQTHSYNTSVVPPQCSPSDVTSVTNTSVLLIILIVSSVSKLTFSNIICSKFVHFNYFPIIRDIRQSIVMYSSVGDGKYSWPILYQNILFDDLILDTCSQILSLYMCRCSIISNNFTWLRYFFCANTATESYVATSNVLAVRSEVLNCNGFVCGIAGSNPDYNMCK